MARPGLDVRAPEVAAVVREFNESRKLLDKEIRREHKAIADDLAGKINQRSSGRKGFRTYGGAWAGTGTIAGAKLYLRSRAGGGGALSAFAGRRPLSRSGWNKSVYVDGVRKRTRRLILPDKPQAREWIGKTYIVGLPGEGPHIVREVAPAESHSMGERYLDAYERALAKVGRGK